MQAFPNSKNFGKTEKGDFGHPFLLPFSPLDVRMYACATKNDNFCSKLHHGKTEKGDFGRPFLLPFSPLDVRMYKEKRDGFTISFLDRVFDQ